MTRSGQVIAARWIRSPRRRPMNAKHAKPAGARMTVVASYNGLAPRTRTAPALAAPAAATQPTSLLAAPCARARRHARPTGSCWPPSSRLSPDRARWSIWSATEPALTAGRRSIRTRYLLKQLLNIAPRADPDAGRAARSTPASSALGPDPRTSRPAVGLVAVLTPLGSDRQRGALLDLARPPASSSSRPSSPSSRLILIAPCSSADLPGTARPADRRLRGSAPSRRLARPCRSSSWSPNPTWA